MKQLVNSWIAAQRHGGQTVLAGAIKDLGRETDLKLNHSRLAEWRKGKYTPSQKAISQMLYDTLPWALQQAGIEVTAEQQAKLDGLIWTVVVTDGDRHIELV